MTCNARDVFFGRLCSFFSGPDQAGIDSLRCQRTLERRLDTFPIGLTLLRGFVFFSGDDRQAMVALFDQLPFTAIEIHLDPILAGPKLIL